MEPIDFVIRRFSAGTGDAEVWDDVTGPRADILQRFLPPERRHPPMVGIIDFGQLRATPNVLRGVVTLGEEIKAGRYGDFTLIVSSEDEATRSVLADIAASQDVALFVSSTAYDLEQAEPVGTLTRKDRETLDLVLKVGGTVTATELARHADIEQTAAGNRLASLHRKGYLQRRERPHPDADQFMDSRSVKPKS